MAKKKRGPHDPMQEATPTPVRRAGKPKKGGRERDRTDRAQCTAHKRNGDRCNNPPVRGSSVCRMHGGSAPQVKAKANRRLVEMVLPAMKELHRILDNPNTADADKLRAIQMVLNRTGYNERQSIDIGLREPTPFDQLQTGAFTILRGEENVIDPGDEHPTLGSGGEEDPLDDALDAALARRDRDREREASRRISNHGHDVVRGDVEDDPSADIFGYPKSRAQKLAESGRPSEHDPDPHRDPDEKPWAAYERRVREGVEDH